MIELLFLLDDTGRVLNGQMLIIRSVFISIESLEGQFVYCIQKGIVCHYIKLLIISEDEVEHVAPEKSDSSVCDNEPLLFRFARFKSFELDA
jgi:hypothetical protein